MKKRTKYIINAIALMFNMAAILSGVFFFLGEKDFSSNQKENSYLIGASYMTMNNEFYKIIEAEIVHRVEAEGASCKAGRAAGKGRGRGSGIGGFCFSKHIETEQGYENI